jgi:hypothetical protein
MPKRLGAVLMVPNAQVLENLCSQKNLNGYETEIITRIYLKKQSLNFIADTMEFDKYGKMQKYYSVRSINNFHKQAFLKLVK